MEEVGPPNFTKKCVTFIGTASIQPYVFQSNRLKENLGASYLVATSLREFVEGAGKPFDLIFEGGGNAALIFSPENGSSSIDRARACIFEWTNRLMDTAPGLRVVAAHVEYVDGGLREALAAARQHLILAENRSAAGSPLGALPIVRSCTSTGLGAEVWSQADRSWVSRQAQTKQEAADLAKVRVDREYGQKIPGFQFPSKLDDLGTTAGEQHIAIVHADGNGIGELFSGIPDQIRDDDKVRLYLKHTSDEVKRAADGAFKKTLSTLAGKIELFTERPGFSVGEYFPLRPIVDGGDDLTFVCHGKLGLWLAATYLRSFEEIRLKGFEDAPEKRVTACAGVAVIPTKFPFARGYQLADQLCRSAKRARKKSGANGSWLDFEIIREGSGLSLMEERSRNYVLGGEKARYLQRRPYRLGEAGKAPTWEEFLGLHSDLLKIPRGKAKELREALWDGTEDQVLKALQSRGYWRGDLEVWDLESRCRLFDPIDAMDLLEVPGGSNAHTEDRVEE